MENVIVNTSALSGLLRKSTAESETRPLESFLLYQTSQWIWHTMSPVILIFGTFGNIMTLVALWRLQTGWSAMNLYLRVLALSDQCVLCTGLLVNWLEMTWSYDVRSKHIVVCKLMVWILNVCALFSPWLLVVLTMERAASVIWPHRVHVICTRQVSLFAITTLWIVCCLLYSHYLYGFVLVISGNTTFCTMGFESYRRFMDNIMLQADLFIYSILPFACLMLSNGVIIFKLVQSVKAASIKLTSTQTSPVETRKKKTSAASATLVVVSAAFVILTLPISIKCVAFSMYNSHFYSSLDKEYIALRYFVNAVVYMLFYLNYAVNFYLYCLTGSKFRNELKRMFFVWGKNISRTSNISVTTQSSMKNETTSENDDF